jgi:acetyltransferase-like isoleucine patch superfamily enzyme
MYKIIDDLKLLIKKYKFLLKDSTIKGNINVLKFGSLTSISNCSLQILGDNNTIQINSGCQINRVNFFIRGNNNTIFIDQNFIFTRGGDLWIEDDNCSIIIGQRSTFELVHLAATENLSTIKIGVDCMFSTNVEVRTGDSHSVIDNISKKRLNPAQNVVIGDHVWVGSNSSILKGSEIASNSILATRSLLTKKIKQSNVMLAGIPAVIIKSNIDWIRERI